MLVKFDTRKRARTLADRGLDFADFPALFEGPHLVRQDVRRDYGEARFIIYGYLSGRLVIAVYTLRGQTHRVISMRKANNREKAHLKKILHR